jgi:hypothetical protein
MLPCIAGMTGMHHQPLVEMGYYKLFPKLASNHSLVARIIDFSHHTQPACILFLGQGLTFLPGLALEHNLPISASPIAEIIGIHHHIWPFLVLTQGLTM